MTRPFLFSLFLFTCFIATPAPAEESAEFDVDAQIVACGLPDTVTVPKDPKIKLCDIYTRQLEYRKERLKLRDSLVERQKNFAAPSIQAYQNYRENLVALNEERREALEAEKKAADSAEEPAENSDE